MLRKFYNFFMEKYTGFLVNIRAYFKRKTLKNMNFSIISKNCVGGIISERMKLQFRSPTVGLSINTPDFIKLCENLEYYMAISPVEIVDKSVSWPVGMIDDVRLDFIHYPDFKTACTKWERRKQRINYDNLFFCMTERPDDCTEELLHRFEKLPYENKICFTHLPRKNPSYIYIYIYIWLRKEWLGKFARA